jgi:hypothetical protein
MVHEDIFGHFSASGSPAYRSMKRDKMLTNRTVVKQTTDTIINFERRCVEQTPPQHRIEDLAIKGLPLKGSCGSHLRVFLLFRYLVFVVVG